MRNLKRGSVLAYTLVILVVISIIASVVFITITRTVQINERSSRNNFNRIILRQAAYEILEDIENDAAIITISNEANVIYNVDKVNKTIKLGFEEGNYLITVTYIEDGGKLYISTWKDEVK